MKNSNHHPNFSRPLGVILTVEVPIHDQLASRVCQKFSEKSTEERCTKVGWNSNKNACKLNLIGLSGMWRKVIGVERLLALRFHGSPSVFIDGNPWEGHGGRWESIFDQWESMRIDFKSILKTFVMDFRDNGFPIDGKSILIDGILANRFSSMAIHGKTILIDGDPWKIDSHPWESMRAQPGYTHRSFLQIRTKFLHIYSLDLFSLLLYDKTKIWTLKTFQLFSVSVFRNIESKSLYLSWYTLSKFPATVKGKTFFHTFTKSFGWNVSQNVSKILTDFRAAKNPLPRFFNFKN